MSTAAATYRGNYSDHIANITTSPITANKVTGRISNQFLNQPSKIIQETEKMPNYGGGSEKCARCSKIVYAAEKRVGAGRSFHTRCFSCQSCNRKLESTTLCEHKGEIFCKTCYTRQFGVHGVAHGVSMTTENSTQNSHQSRRSSYGCDLDEPEITHEQIRRSHSNDDKLRGEHSAIFHDELPKMFPWKNDILPQEKSPTINKVVTELDQVVDRNHQRPLSQIGFQKLVESTVDTEDDRSRYRFDDNQTYYPNRVSTTINVPFVSPTNRSNSTIEQMEIPLLPKFSNESNKIPSTNSPDIYRRQHSQEYQIDVLDNFSPVTPNENRVTSYCKIHSKDNTTPDTFVTQNPLIKPTYSHSSSYENKQVAPKRSSLYDEEDYSGNSPSANVNSNRSSSYASGYEPSHVHGGSGFGESTSSPSANRQHQDYFNDRSSNPNVLDRRSSSSSSRQSEQMPSALNEFVSRTNISGPSTTERYSVLGNLVNAFRLSKDDLQN